VVELLGETRYGLELTQLVASRRMLRPGRDANAGPVLLIPGFMAGDGSMAVLGTWLARRGHRVSMSGIHFNAGCANRTAGALQVRVREFAERSGRPVTLIGQSRGGMLARCVAIREPESVEAIVMLGSPVRDPLAVNPSVLSALRSVARLVDAGIPGLFSTGRRDGDCCVPFHRDLAAPLPPSTRAVAVYSRSDGVVDWRACLDPAAEQVEVSSSHCGMSVNSAVYELLEKELARTG
jgi:pimeloyl-ACP methyl ester carboxylesterase